MMQDKFVYYIQDKFVYYITRSEINENVCLYLSCCKFSSFRESVEFKGKVVQRIVISKRIDITRMTKLAIVYLLLNLAE